MQPYPLHVGQSCRPARLRRQASEKFDQVHGTRRGGGVCTLSRASVRRSTCTILSSVNGWVQVGSTKVV